MNWDLYFGNNRKCQNPNCNQELSKKQKRFCSNRCSAKIVAPIRNNNESWKLSQKLVQTGLKHKPFPASRAIKMSTIMKGRVSPVKGMKLNPLSEERKRHLSEMNKGKKLQPFSKERKLHHREGAIKRLRRDNIHCLGRNEKTILDKQEHIDNCKIDRGFVVQDYRPDGYCHETNTIYEIYENYHNRRVFEDLIRENNICTFLGCDFVIIFDRGKTNGK